MIANLQCLEGKSKKGQEEKERLLKTRVESLRTLVHLESQNLVHLCPRSARQKLAQLVVDHITLLGFVQIRACCAAKLGHRASECPNQGTHAFGTYALGAVFDAMCYGADSLATVEEAEEEQGLNEIEEFVAFSMQEFGRVCHS